MVAVAVEVIIVAGVEFCTGQDSKMAQIHIVKT